MIVAALGWLGAALALCSYAQRSPARLRQVSLLSSITLVSFNLWRGIWSNVALESALIAINTRRLLDLRNERRCIDARSTALYTVRRSTVPPVRQPSPDRARPAGSLPMEESA